MNLIKLSHNNELAPSIVCFTSRYKGNAFIRERYDYYFGESLKNRCLSTSSEATDLRIDTDSMVNLYSQRNMLKPRIAPEFDKRNGDFYLVYLFKDILLFCPKCGDIKTIKKYEAFFDLDDETLKLVNKLKSNSSNSRKA